jgi:hypothetical protein
MPSSGMHDEMPWEDEPGKISHLCMAHSLVLWPLSWSCASACMERSALPLHCIYECKGRAHMANSPFHGPLSSSLVLYLLHWNCASMGMDKSGPFEL